MKTSMAEQLAEVSKNADEYMATAGQHGRVQTEKSKGMDQILKLMEIDAQIQLANKLNQLADSDK